MEGSTELEEHLRDDYRNLVRAVAPAARNRADAEDAVQEAYARAWERIDRGERIDDLSAWIVTVALNRLRSRWRRLATERKYRPQLVPDPRTPDHDRLADLRTALRRLPVRQQQAVVLQYLLGYKGDEVAEILGISPGTVKSALSRARATLGEALGEQELVE